MGVLASAATERQKARVVRFRKIFFEPPAVFCSGACAVSTSHHRTKVELDNLPNRLIALGHQLPDPFIMCIQRAGGPGLIGEQPVKDIAVQPPRKIGGCTSLPVDAIRSPVQTCRTEIASTISRINQGLDEELEKFARRRLEEAYPYRELECSLREDPRRGGNSELGRCWSRF
jgi:hypothetical protein